LVFATATVGKPVIVVVFALLVAAVPELECTESPPP
jgi:hypothetical protein